MSRYSTQNLFSLPETYEASAYKPHSPILCIGLAEIERAGLINSALKKERGSTTIQNAGYLKMAITQNLCSFDRIGRRKPRGYKPYKEPIKKWTNEWRFSRSMRPMRRHSALFTKSSLPRLSNSARAFAFALGFPPLATLTNSSVFIMAALFPPIFVGMIRSFAQLKSLAKVYRSSRGNY